MLELFGYEFFKNAVISSLFMSIVCGIIGTLVVVNRMVFIAGGVSHASYGGVGLAFYYKINPIIGITCFSLFVSLLIGALTYRRRKNLDAIIGAIWASGMAFGILLIDMTPGYNVDLMSYLFGSILAVTNGDLFFMGLTSVIVLFLICFFYREILAISYDEDFAITLGIKTKLVYFTLMALIGLSIVVLIQQVGLILCIAMLTIPAYIAEHFSNSLYKMMMIAAVLCFTFAILGLGLSYVLNLTSGATIILFSIIALIASKSKLLFQSLKFIK